MEANAPEKIWLGKYTQNLMLFDPNSNTYVEYTRTDAFIEKAISWLKEQDEMIGVSFQEDFIERFKNYIKR